MSRIKRLPKPNIKGQELVMWRKLLYGMMFRREETVPCRLCHYSIEWGKRCCWECDRLHLCLPKWKYDFEGRGDTRTRNCPFAGQKFKSCHLVYERMNEMGIGNEVR